MDIIQAIILGIVEGVTEFLPISSTGHLAVVAHWLGVADDAFLPSFNIAIQLGAILAVVVLYARTLFTRPALWLRLFIAMIPTAVVGASLYSMIRPLLNNVWVVVIAIGAGGLVMIGVEWWLKRKSGPPVEEESNEVALPSLKHSFFIGLYQVLSFIPGVSRSAATIVGGLVHGLPRKMVVEFSFLLAVPTMIAATGYDLLRSSQEFSSSNWGALAVGFGVAFAVAFFVIKWLLRFIKKYSFTVFGVYRVFAAVIFTLIVFL